MQLQVITNKESQMNLLHQENYLGNNNKDFRIRIFDHETKATTVITRALIETSGEEIELHVVRYDDRHGSPLDNLIEKAKNTILLITRNA